MLRREVKMNTLCILLLILKIVTADTTVNCSVPVQNVTCVCADTFLSCSGIQHDHLEIVELVTNISDKFPHGDVLSVDISVENLILSPNSSFQDVAVENLKLGLGLSYLEDNLFLGIRDFLHVLNLTHNSFDEIPSNALIGLSKLHTLDLSYNSIKVLPKNVFEGLYNLTILNLSHNAITVVEFEAFSKLSLLEVLYLEYNNLHFLNATVFKDLHSLNHLSVSGNNFDLLSYESFAMLPSLQILFADKNTLSALENIQVDAPKLQKLSVQHCVIQGPLKANSLNGLSNLNAIDFSHNNITEVQHHALSALFQLNSANLSYNKIRTLGKEAFSSLFNLINLDLQHNDIEIVARSAFYNLTKLKYLNLNNNKLSALVCPYTADLWSLESIHLENNQIKTIESGVFTYSLKLGELKLTGNNLECDCFMYDFYMYLLNYTSNMKGNASGVECNSPGAVRGKNVTEVDYSSFGCSSTEPCESNLVSYFDYDTAEDEEESNVTSSFENSTAVDTSAEFTTMSNNQTLLTLLVNLTRDYTGVVHTTSFPGLESISSEISNSTSSTVSSVINFSIVNITTDEDLNYTSTEISRLPETDSPAVITLTDNVTSEEASSISWFSSTLSEVASSVVVPVSNENDTSLTYPEFNVSSPTATESSQPDPSASSSDPENYTDVAIIQVSDTTVSETTVNPFLLAIARNAVVDIKQHSFNVKNKFLCIDWSVPPSVFSEMKNCLISYTRVKDGAAVTKRTKCPSSSNDVFHHCERIKTATVINDFCIKIMSASDKTLANTCTHEHYVDTVPELPLTSDLTYSSESVTTESGNNATGFFADMTVYNGTQSTEVSLTTTQKISSRISFVTPILPKQTTSVFTEVTSQHQTDFNITNLKIARQGDSATIEWTVNRNEPFDRCTLEINIKSEKINKIQSDFSCSNHSYSVNPEENDIIHEICLTSNHSMHGIVVVCRNFNVYSHEAMMSTGKSSKDYTYAILIGLLVLVICFLAFLVAKAVLKSRKSADGYNVSNEERKVSLRNGSTHASVNHEHTSRYSYNASEVI